MKKVRINGEHGYPIKVHGLDEGGSGKSLDFTITGTSDIVDGQPVIRTDAKWSDIVNAAYSGKRIWLNLADPYSETPTILLMQSRRVDASGQLENLLFYQTTYTIAAGSVNTMYVTSFVVSHDNSEEDEDKVSIAYDYGTKVFGN